MTVDSMAAQYYNQYNLSNNTNAQTSDSDMSKKDYDLSDLSGALNAASSTRTDNLSITNMNQYT